MYKCQNCGNQTKESEKLMRKVVEKRPVEYKVRQGWDEYLTYYGWEIVKELHVCHRCYDTVDEAESPSRERGITFEDGAIPDDLGTA